MTNEKRKCKACGLQFYTTDPTKELCHCCTEALKRLDGYAVPVVRCCQCKSGQMREDGTVLCKFHSEYGERDERCGSHSVWMEPDDFCSYGERKDNG